MWISSRVNIWHWVWTPLHTTIWVHKIIHWWDWSRRPDRSWRIHVSVCEWTADRCWFTITRRDCRGWWRFWLFGCRRLGASVLGLLLLATFSTAILKPNLKLNKKQNEDYSFNKRYDLNKLSYWKSLWAKHGLRCVCTMSRRFIYVISESIVWLIPLALKRYFLCNAHLILNNWMLNVIHG